ncbi:MAG: amidohydrolase [Sphingomonadaceae bacterium]
MRKAGILSVLLLSLSGGAFASADMVIINGQVKTFDDRITAASAVAMEDGVIVKVGSDAEAMALADDKTHIIDAAGRPVLPGFIDSHIHPQQQFDEMAPYGRLDLRPEGGVTSREALFEKLRRKIAVTPPGQLIVGSRYNDNLVGGHPTAKELDAVSPNHPVILGHSSGHRRVVNTLALKGAGITDSTPNPPGGMIERDADGKATGIMLESVPCFGPLYDTIPQPTEAEILDAYRKEFRMYLSYGIVGIGDAGGSPEKYARFRTLLQEGMPIHIYAMLSYDHLDWLTENRNSAAWQVPGLQMRAIKTSHGNSLSGRTAWLYEPYAHDPDYYGIPPRRSQEELNERVAKVHDAGLQLAIHSNGDREIDMVLTAIELAQKANPRTDHRHRIEHASVVNDRILRRVKAANVMLAPHSYVLNHGEKMEEFGAHRWDYMHPNRSATELGIPIGGNSDHSVSPAQVMQRIESMVTRRAAGNGKVYGAAQRVPVDTALKIWTSGSAFIQFSEDTHGSLTPGKRGDIVILSQDPNKVEADDIEKIDVDYTVVGGKVAFRRGQNGADDYYSW